MSTEAEENLIAHRKWAFQQAMNYRVPHHEDAADVIYKAAEIEAYIMNGKNLGGEFQCRIECAVNDAECASIPGVSDNAKGKVMEVVRECLKDYDALGPVRK